jgi:3-hydroxyisobutyrate dehydrogenase-like beta-hydroxyacid dehydrogenase
VSAQGPVGFIGLGAMGEHLAGAMLDAGYELAVLDARAEAMEPIVARGARGCASPAEVADIAAIVLASLPTPDIVRAVACGERGVREGSAVRTFVDLSTTGSVVAREIAATLAAAGIDAIDAPVSGGVAGARARTLAAMGSGPSAAFEEVRPMLETFARKVFYVGEEPGQGQIAKLLNNLLSATAVTITGEAMVVGVRAGLDPATLLDIFNNSSGRNTATTDKIAQQVLTRRFDAGFRLRLMAKDIELCASEARSLHVPMLLGSLVQQLWTLAAVDAGDDDDHTAIVRMFEEWAGVRVESPGGGADAGA